MVFRICVPMTKTSQKKNNKAPTKKGSPLRFFLLIIIPLIVFSLGFVPVIIVAKIIFYFISFNTLIGLILLPLIIGVELFLLLISEILISGAIIRIFNIKYKEGTYDYTMRKPQAFRWMLVCQLYTPMRKLLEIIPMGYVKLAYLRLLGMKIGKNCLVGGVIKDPCATEFGDNVTMGEYAVLYAHIHDYEKGTLTVKKVRIGSNCTIGAGSIIMPGVVMKDHSILGAGGLATKNLVLDKNKVYGGNPAKEISKKKVKK